MVPFTVAGWSIAVALGCVAVGLRRRLELVARADHELRGPLAAIGLAVERVRRGHGGAELAGVLDSQLDRARAGLADLHAARSGSRRASRREPIQLDRHVRAAAAAWGPLAGRRGRPLRLDWRAGPVRVAADRGHVAQALGNLISNAVEHGDGAIEVRGRRVGAGVRIEVADADAGDDGGRGPGRGGIGPTATKQDPRVPRRSLFRPLSARRGRGLLIATRAARASGGRLEIASAGGGVTAALELPAEEA